MRSLIVMLAVACVAMAMTPIFGPAGIPTDWSGSGIITFEAEKFTSPLATCYLTMVGDTLFLVSTVAGDADFGIIYQEASGEQYPIFHDDGLTAWHMENLSTTTRFAGNKIVSMGGEFSSSNGNGTVDTGDASGLILFSNSGTAQVLIDPNEDGAGITKIGVLADNDTLQVDCAEIFLNGTTETNTLIFESWYGLTRTVDSDYTVTVSDWQITVTDTARITLPALAVAFDSLSANTGNALQVDIWTSSDACTISSVADSIYGFAEIILTPGDNLSFRATPLDFWITR